jgi:2'-5' RNA ligase
MRLFVAIELPTGWREAAAEAQRTLIQRVPPRTLRPVDPALMHLTLRFLGEVEDEALPLLQRELAALEPVDVQLALGAAGSFGAARSTRVAWLAIEGDRDGLAALARRVERAVVAAGAPPEPRPFRPHLTLARVTRGADGEARRAVAEALAALPRPAAAPFHARRIALVRSHLGGPHGPRYEPLLRHP